MKVTVCVKHAPRRVTVDPLTALVSVDPHDVGMSAADEAALEIGLTLGGEVTVVTAGPVDADGSLRAASAVGAHRLVRCPSQGHEHSVAVAHALADVAAGSDLVLCGDYSADRGSGAVPGFVAAELGIAQALGVVVVDSTSEGVEVQRRLDRGRREVLRLRGPAVVSVEGAVARLRRASLRGMVDAEGAPIELGPTVSPSSPRALRPHRPRVHPRPAPSADLSPFDRIQQVTQATVTRTPPRLVHLDPASAADSILEALRGWGYLPDED